MISSFQQHLPRWIYASCSSAFKTRLGDMSMYLEGESRRTENETDFVEFRLDGPYITELSKGYFRVDFEINLLISCQQNRKDFHKLYKDCGVALQCFNEPISIFKLGDGDNDDQTLIDCAILPRSKDQREAVRVSHFGKVDPAKPLLQSSVEGHYHFFVTVR